MSDDLDPDVSRTDIVDSRVAAILRAKSGMERAAACPRSLELAVAKRLLRDSI